MNNKDCYEFYKDEALKKIKSDKIIIKDPYYYIQIECQHSDRIIKIHDALNYSRWENLDFKNLKRVFGYFLFQDDNYFKKNNELRYIQYCLGKYMI